MSRNSYEAKNEPEHADTKLSNKKMKKNYKKPQRYWTAKEIKFLRENYHTMRRKDIADHLNRSGRSITTYASTVLGMRKGVENG